MVSRTSSGPLTILLLSLRVLLASAAAPPASKTDLHNAALQADLYPTRAWACVGGFIGFVAVCHFLSLISMLWRRTPPYSPEARNRSSIRLGRLPAAFGSLFRTIAFRWTVSFGGSYSLNIAEIFMTAGYIAILFSWSLINSTSTLGSKVNPHIYGDTAGHIAATQVPLVAALGMKNNVISLLTGVSVNRLNFLHRMTSRVLLVLIWLHAAARIEIGIDPSLWATPWIQCGVLAGAALGVLAIVSIRPLRNRMYEFFKFIHLILAWMFVAAAYWHARNDGYGQYLWPALLVMGFDHFLRALRLVVYNFGYIIGRRPTGLDAQVEVLSSDFMRISLHRPQHVNWAPGQSAFISMPGIAPFQFHPFTISTVDISGMPPTKFATDSQAHLAYSSATDAQKLTFLVRVRKGFTHRLHRNAQDDKSLKVFFDGPYGSPPVLKGFGTVILIAGGSGVSFTLPLLLDLVHRAARGEVPCHKAVFIWAFRDPSHFKWISEAILPLIQNLPDSIMVEIRLFTTGPMGEDSLSYDSALENKKSIVSMNRGRPNIRELMKEEIADATGDISVNVCGTDGLAKNVKAALRNPRFLDILRGGPTVDLHLETFGV